VTIERTGRPAGLSTENRIAVEVTSSVARPQTAAAMTCGSRVRGRAAEPAEQQAAPAKLEAEKQAIDNKIVDVHRELLK
jgi:hypothetical protein